MYEIAITNKYKQDVKKANQRGYDMNLLEKIVDMLAKGEKLPDKCRNHALKGKHKGDLECHISPNWLLIYKIEKEKLTLYETGTHADLF